MPELPEVEIVRSGLEITFANQPSIERVVLHRGDLRFPMPADLNDRLRGAHVCAVRRRAKYLLIDTDRGILLSHLGMTGVWRVVEKGEKLVHDPHQHVDIHLHDGRMLSFRDPRRFGVLDFIETGKENHHHLLKHLGPEPFADSFDAEYLFQRSRKRIMPVKGFIMDQKVVVGVGNIYASEALFKALIKPSRKAGSVTREGYVRLVKEIRKILKAAIRAGGSSISDFRGTQGDAGYFQRSFQVYDRAGEPCRVCKAPLKSKIIAGRNTYWCAKCQT